MFNLLVKRGLVTLLSLVCGRAKRSAVPLGVTGGLCSAIVSIPGHFFVDILCVLYA